MEPGLVWTTVDAQLEEYAAHWRDQIEGMGVIPREKWEDFWRDLVQLRFARTDEKTQFDQSFTNTGRHRNSQMGRTRLIRRLNSTSIL
jgi:hypothetical protein